MRKSMFAALATTVALAVGLVVPATGTAAKTRSVKTRAASSSLTDLCNALGLKPLLEGLDVNLSPLIRVHLSRVCE